MAQDCIYRVLSRLTFHTHRQRTFGYVKVGVCKNTVHIFVSRCDELHGCNVQRNAVRRDRSIKSRDVQGHVLHGQVSNQVNALARSFKRQASVTHNRQMTVTKRNSDSVFRRERETVLTDQADRQISRVVNSRGDRHAVEVGQRCPDTLVGKALEIQLVAIEEGKAACGHFVGDVALVVKELSNAKLLVTDDQCGIALGGVVGILVTNDNLEINNGIIKLIQHDSALIKR